MTRLGPTTEADRDFPFYDGAPRRVPGVGWLVALAMTAAGFGALVATPALLSGRAGGWVGVGLFVALPLLGLRLAAGRDWAALFHRPTAREIGIGLAFGPLTLLVSAIVAIGFAQVGLTAGNPVVGIMLKLHGLDLALFVAATAPQLLGEELVTAIPFLALLTLLSGPFGLPRWTAILGAWVGSAALFGLLHLPTYQWHVGQVLLIIGTARLILTLPFLITKNLWVSTVAHITNDWTVFALVLIAGRLAP